MAVDPRGSDLAAFLADDQDSPVVMLNLLRFADGGRELCQQYTQAFRDTFASRLADPEYQQITHLRTSALQDAVLQPPTTWRAQ